MMSALRGFGMVWIVVLAVAEPSRASDADVDAWVQAHIDELVPVYQHLHANPELSLHEVKTAKFVAEKLRAAGYEVTTGVGGTGVVGVLENGEGPTLLIRGDMDALPVIEATGLPYASKRTSQRPDGSTVGVMHACGHDVHTTNLIGTAQMLAELRKRWSGTLVIIAQPAEELGEGARAMMADGLFERFPRPDIALALHVSASLPAGQVGIIPGWAFANVDSADITVYGRGGHGARPHQAIDPVLAAAHIVVALQSLVSRRVDPQEPAVVTVGSIHGGTKHNLIPDEVHLQLTVRSYSDEVRSQLLEGIRQIATDTCRAYGCTKAPEVAFKESYTPAVYNDPELSAQAAEVFAEVLGEEQVVVMVPGMGGEDFGRYPRQLDIPGLLFRLGAVSEGAKEPLPSIHSSRFAPDAQPTLETGLRTMGTLALRLLPN